MFSLIVTIAVVIVALLAVAAWRPELVKRAAAWLVAAGAVVAGWMNSDVISGWFQ